MKKCIVLFSGGIDSTTALYWAKNKYDRVEALTFDYGQRHRIEIDFSKQAIKNTGVPQTILTLDLTQIGGSSLTDESIPVPVYDPNKKDPNKLPSSYVPFRNGIFLSLAAAWGEAHGIHEIICGFNVIDSLIILIHEENLWNPWNSASTQERQPAAQSKNSELKLLSSR